MRSKSFFALIMMMILAINSNGQGTWTRKADFGGGARFGTFQFSIGGKGYVGTGADDANVFKSDFWEFDPVSGVWTQKADFGGGIRVYGTGFSVGNKGYAGTGIVGSYNWRKDMWEYNPGSNSWRQVADFGGGFRYSVVSFSIGNKGYMGTGSYRESPWVLAIYYNDFWEYDPVADTWTRKADVADRGRHAAIGLSIVDKGYIGLGYYYYDTRMKDFWEYDPSSDSWTRKADFGGIQRVGAAAFSIGNKGYVGTGWNYSGFNDFWEFNPSTNSWTEKATFPGDVRNVSAYFSIGNKGYIGLGGNSVSSLADFWEYTPVPSCALSVVVPDVYAVNPGGNRNTIYIGYGPSSFVLTTNVSSGEAGNGQNYSYAWSDGSTGQSINVNPSAPGDYSYSVTVSDVNGCTAGDTIIIHVMDIRCGKKNEKVTVCQVPPSNPGNAHTICVSSNAVAAHLKNGSYLGACNDQPLMKNDVNTLSLISDETGEDALSVYPNPNSGSFIINVTNNMGTELVLQLSNTNGQVIRTNKIPVMKGVQSIRIDLGPHAQGVYWIRMSGTKYVAVKKVIIL